MPAAASSASLHRIRFYDYKPAAIAACAFAPQLLPPACDPLDQQSVSQSSRGLPCLIVARDNGYVEVWEHCDSLEGNGNWILQRALPPSRTHPSISTMALVWRGDGASSHSQSSALRLFTAGSDSDELVERCLISGRTLQVYRIPNAPIWSITASPTQSLLCISTNAPHLQFLYVPPSPGDSNTPLETMPQLRSDALPLRTRTVSVAWGPPKLELREGRWMWRDTYLITGNTDSSIRRWDLPAHPGARTVLRNRGVLEKYKVKDVKATIVWGVAVAADGTIVSCDSLGYVIFWNSDTMSQRHSFQAHKADAMCMALGPRGRTVFTSGPDQRVCQFTLDSTGWKLSASKRIHVHDVRCLAVSEVDGFAPILVSGGWDMALAFTTCADASSSELRNPIGRLGSRVLFEDAQTRRASPIAAGSIKIARGARLMIGQKDAALGIWRLKEPWTKTLEMELQLRSSLVAVDISDDGRWLVVSDLYETKLYRLEEGAVMLPRRVDIDLHSSTKLRSLDLTTRGTGSTVVTFTPDSRRLVLALDAHIAVVNLALERDPVVAEVFVLRPHALSGVRNTIDLRGTRSEPSHANSDDEDNFTNLSDHWAAHLASSPDGQWLAVSSRGAVTSIFNLDTLQLHAVLPTTRAITALAFAPAHPLLILLHPQSISLYHLEDRRMLSDSDQLQIINKHIQVLQAPATFVAFEPIQGGTTTTRLLISSHDWLLTAVVDFNPFVLRRSRGNGNRKREARATFSSSSVHFDSAIVHGGVIAGRPNAVCKVDVESFRGIVAADWLGEGEMLVVERPYGDYVNELPPAFVAATYGKA